MKAFTTIQSPLGELLLTGTEAGLEGLFFVGKAHAKKALVDDAREDASVFTDAITQLGEYFEGSRSTFELMLTPKGTPFQKEVWEALAAIPYGTTTTYSAIARSIRKPLAVRAVGAANGQNPLSIIVPCHRVVGQDGTLTGYAGGLKNKQILLELEKG